MTKGQNNSNLPPPLIVCDFYPPPTPHITYHRSCIPLLLYSPLRLHQYQRQYQRQNLRDSKPDYNYLLDYFINNLRHDIPA